MKTNRKQPVVKTATHQQERALRLTAFQCRPLWRTSERPDRAYGPRLTLVARQLLNEERTYVANDYQ